MSTFWRRKDDGHLEHRARQEGDEDLRDRELEAKCRLPEHLKRDDHRSQVQARISHRGQEHRVLRAADPDSRPAGGDGGRAH